MKKLLLISITLFLIITGIISLNKDIDNHTDQLLYKDRTQISLVMKQSADYNKFNQSIIKASNNDTSISQYFYQENGKLKIFSNNAMLPTKGHNNYSKNFGETANKLLIPNNKYDIKLYDYNSVKNLGINNTFYVKGNVQKVIKIMNKFGHAHINDFIDKNTYELSNLTNVLITDLIFAFAAISSLILIRIRQSKQILINKLMGLTNLNNLWSVTKEIINIFIISLIISSIFMICYATFESLLQYYQIYWGHIILIWLGFLIIILFIYILSVLFQIKSKNITIKNNTLYMLTIIINILAFTTCSVIMAIQMPNIHRNINSYIQNAKPMNKWKKTKEIYQTNTTNQLDRQNDQSEYNFDINAKELLTLLNNHNIKHFIVFSNNFLGDYDNNTGYSTPWYKVNPDNKSKLDYIVNPSGKMLLADKNYLKLSKTKLINNKNINSIKNIKNTKTLIVPIKYKKYEKIIRKHYLKEFLFELTSDYKQWKRKIYDTKFNKNNLKINIEYAKNNQKYFTYNKDSGENISKNTVNDPIIVLFDKYEPSWTYGNLFVINGGLFFFDNSDNKAYKNLYPLLAKAKMSNTINYVQSIYSNQAQTIKQLNDALRDSLTQTIMIIIVMLYSASTMITHFYLLMYKKILIKRIVGHTLLDIIKIPLILICSPLIITYLAYIMIVHYFNVIDCSIIVFTLLFSISICFLTLVHNIKNNNKIMGGEED